MKYVILMLVLIGGACKMQGQEKKPSLKDLLFSGKLKKDSSGVIRSTDDLSQKIDTSTKKETSTVSSSAPATNVQQDAATNSKAPASATVAPNTTVASGTTVAATGVGIAATNADTTAAAPVAATNAPAKSNTKLLKEYVDSVVRALQEGPLKAKQIKKDTYFVMLDYEIDTNGDVNFTNVTSTPENAFLQAQVKQIVDSTPLHLTPVTDSNNQGKKVKRKQQFSVTKE